MIKFYTGCMIYSRSRFELRGSLLRSLITFVVLAASVLIFHESFAQTTNPPRVASTPPAPMTVQPIVHYDALPLNVKQRIDANKIAGADLYQGILTVFTIDIPTCVTAQDLNYLLSFMNGKPGFVRNELMQPGRVQTFVHPTFGSVALKELLIDKGISFQFVNESTVVDE